MKIELKYIGKSIVELHIEAGNVQLYEDIADVNGKVDEQFITELSDIVEELKKRR